MARVAALASSTPEVASPSITPAGSGDAAAQLQRFRDVLESLRSHHVHDGWSVDEPAAAKALAYFEGRVAATADDDLPNEDTGVEDVIRFLAGHGQPVDFVFGNDMGSIFASLARHSQRAAKCGGQANDPSWGAIETHRRATMAFLRAIKVESQLAPRDRKFKAASVAANRKWAAFKRASEKLVERPPSSWAGLRALLDYVHRFNTGAFEVGKGNYTEPELWPEDLRFLAEKLPAAVGKAIAQISTSDERHVSRSRGPMQSEIKRRKEQGS
jgi:hypothetical protein